MAVSDVLRLSVGGRIGDVSIANVFHYRVIDEGDDTFNTVECIDAFNADVVPSWRAAVSEQYEFLCAKCSVIHPAPSATAFTYGYAGETGNIVGESMGPAACAKIRQYTVDLSKRGRGRKYFAGVADISQTLGSLTPAMMALLRTLRDDLQSIINHPVSSFQAEPVIWSEAGDKADTISSGTPSAKVWQLSRRQSTLC